MITNDTSKSQNQQLVENFMLRMRSDKQAIPVRPTMPSLEIRMLRASLMLEETLETIRKGLGLEVCINSGMVSLELEDDTEITFKEDKEPSLIEIADGCADVEVVTLGTASACGIAHQPIFNAVMGNNLYKFAPGHSFRADGKMIKPADHPNVAPLIVELLARQGMK